MRSDYQYLTRCNHKSSVGKAYKGLTVCIEASKTGGAPVFEHVE